MRKHYYTIEVEHRPHIWVIVAYYKYLGNARRDFPYFQQRYGESKTRVSFEYE